MKALILGCQGLELSPEEKENFNKIQPLGFILLERNCKSPEQVRKLIQDLRACVNHSNAPVLIDQEGGRVQRLKSWCRFPAAQEFSNDLDGLKQNVTSLSQALKNIHVNVNCAPCCDLIFDGADQIIGDRSFGRDVDNVIEKASQWIQSQDLSGITSVIKHIRGHGRAESDSHFALPVVEASIDELKQYDMAVFQALSKKHPKAWGMTAHIVYKALDPHLPATLSKTVINDWIRGWIGFEGLLLSDCLHMDALSGPLSKRAEQSLEAGCDVALYCTIADIEKQKEVAKGCSEFTRADLIPQLF